ncbi:MAG: barstar family protein [Anaerotignum sp.]|nr:barstar family protein [Anaerotignum sp.]
MKYILDGKKMVSREETHVYLKETFGFPDYYGKNLDALHDCLTEMADLEVEFINEEDMLATLGRYGEKLLQVLDEVKNRPQ